jgi:tetratricopeptide (TPR) repeat protein
MKKIILTSALALFATGVYAQVQGVDQMLAEEQCKTFTKDKASADKAALDAKKSLKAATWINRAKIYADIPFQCAKIDSMAGVTAYESYKKALEIEPAGKAVKEINAALNGQDENSKLYNSVMQCGIGYNNSKSYANAYKCFSLASEIKKSDSTSSLYSGYMAQQINDEANLVKYFEKFVEQGGSNSYVFYALAQKYKVAKQLDKALAILKKGVEKNPADKDLKGEIININIGRGNNDDVVADLKKLVDADPKNVNYLFNLGAVYDNSGKKELALETYRKVIDLDPTNFDANYGVGVLYFNQAVEIKKAVDKMDMKTYKTEGKAVEEKVCTKFKESQSFFEAANKVKPNDEDLKSNLVNLKGVLDQCATRK